MNFPQTLLWQGECDGRLRLLDQTRLPETVAHIECVDPTAVWQAIRSLAVRGAPAIGIAAAYGVVLAVGRQARCRTSVAELSRLAIEAADFLATSRPTAVNLFWALDRMKAVAISHGSDQNVNLAVVTPLSFVAALLSEAKLIHQEDRAMCAQMGEHGRALIRDCRSVLTHCNAGALATAGMGTALAPIYAAHRDGQAIRVYADETRPLLQGARITAWELAGAGVEVVVICDNMAAALMRRGAIDAVIVGADRITARGDVANKIGTYGVAVLAKHHGIPFYVAAPSNTFDLTLYSGDEIPIEHRSAEEVTHIGSRQVVPAGVEVANPAFDTTPAELISAIVTERGIISPVTEMNVRNQLAGKGGARCV